MLNDLDIFGICWYNLAYIFVLIRFDILPFLYLGGRLAGATFLGETCDVHVLFMML